MLALAVSPFPVFSLWFSLSFVLFFFHFLVTSFAFILSSGLFCPSRLFRFFFSFSVFLFCRLPFLVSRCLLLFFCCVVCFNLCSDFSCPFLRSTLCVLFSVSSVFFPQFRLFAPHFFLLSFALFFSLRRFPPFCSQLSIMIVSTSPSSWGRKRIRKKRSHFSNKVQYRSRKYSSRIRNEMDF